MVHERWVFRVYTPCVGISKTPLASTSLRSAYAGLGQTKEPFHTGRVCRREDRKQSRPHLKCIDQTGDWVAISRALTRHPPVSRRPSRDWRDSNWPPPFTTGSTQWKTGNDRASGNRSRFTSWTRFRLTSIPFFPTLEGVASKVQCDKIIGKKTLYLTSIVNGFITECLRYNDK